MKNTYVLVSILILVILGAGAYVYFQKSSDSSEVNVVTDNTQAERTDKPTQKTSDEAMVAKPGSYKDYSESELSSTTGTRLLFFHAPWCLQCRQLDESIKSSELPENTTIFKVDYDSNQELREKYGVTIQTTVVKIGNDGNKIDSYIAYQTPTFENVKAALLK